MLLMTTIDDLPTEGIPYIIEKIIETGAKNVHVINALTKKGRVEYIVLVDFEEKFLKDISSLLALEFGTLGMKIIEYEHIKFPYEIKRKTAYLSVEEKNIPSKVHIKYLYDENKKIISLKAEYDDIKKIIEDMNKKGIEISFSKLKTMIESEAYKNPLENDEINISL